MIINKITTGFVIQQFDTEKQKFVSQEFVAGDEVDWETEDGQPADMEAPLVVDGQLQPILTTYLPFNMEQPDG